MATAERMLTRDGPLVYGRPFLSVAIAPVVGAMSIAMVLSWWLASAGSSSVGASTSVAPLNGAALEPAVNLPALTLTRSDGGTFTSADTHGRTSLFFFGYTHCADVCPLTLAEFAQIRRALGNDAAGVDMYFVTLDPARDTLPWMRTYVANFPGVTGLIGSDVQLALAQAVFNVVAARRDLRNGDYALEHTAAMYLVNSASQIQLAYPYGTASDDIVSDLHRLLL
jgi:protein SCO1/2